LDHLQRVEKILGDVLLLAASEHKRSGFCIGNTSKVDSSGLYFSPIRNTRQLVAGSVIVYEAHHASEIARAVDGRVDYVLVDAEKKVEPEPDYFGSGDRGNIERAVRDEVKISTILTYKGNDLSVDSIDCILTLMTHDIISGIGGKKVTIIGAGNLGSKLALRLVERGANVTLTRRNQEKLVSIVKALNYIKPEQTFGVVRGTTDNEEGAAGADILVGMTNGIPVISSKMVDALAPNALIMDAGKGCLFPDAIKRANAQGLTIMRVDVRPGFDGQVAMLMRAESLLKQTLGRSVVNGVSVVSGGLLAREGEVVVDDVHAPRVVFGVADGCGDFVRILSSDEEARVQVVKESIDQWQPATGT